MANSKEEDDYFKLEWYDCDVTGFRGWKAIFLSGFWEASEMASVQFQNQF